MNAELIVIGRRASLRPAPDSFLSALEAEVGDAGLRLAYATLTAPVEREVEDCIRHALSRSHLIIISGERHAEEFVKKMLSRILDKRLILNEELLVRIRGYYAPNSAANGKAPPAGSDKTALLPSGSTFMSAGTERPFGFYLEEHGRFIVYLSAPDCSGGGMVPQEVAERLKVAAGPRESEVFGLVRTCGISVPTVESAISGRLAEGLSAYIDDTKDGVDVTVSYRAGPGERSDEILAGAVETVRGLLGGHVYATGPEGIEYTVAGLLTGRGFTITTAESCTGGLIAKRLTDVPGSSAYMERGLVTYSYRSKLELLGVPLGTLEEFGAVSEQTAKAMAEGARWYSSSDIGLSVTGIAGPDGGTDEKPVGLVFIGLATPEGAEVKRCNFTGSRDDIRYATSQKALDILRRHLMN